ncbi:Ribosomal protein S18 acetylase RimI [Sphingopyxis sp. YR583]|jgi:predicted GNAT family N-acyltransferase|uniref:GNAT family N-acetyltransferase n=1 Tax=Sphingopyxis sp. YR583 TaxID=1881047 RepID=UPI0008A7D308|nr:GNAT family N-acetyltransferase [Sphingopyxis sp. YR583]SEH20381.1 Ribosomal protein S18 acetylase RimI [Sphingopyxis sp. YR583]
MPTTAGNHDVIARAYTPLDEGACLALFDGNVPEFFSPAERHDFERFLIQRTSEWPYQVLERRGRIVGCGGLAIEKDSHTADLCWGMIVKSLHGTGLGRMLAELRLRLAATTPGIAQIRLDTSQHTQGFYAAFGFEVLKITRHGYGPGLDRWDMLLRFDDDQRRIWTASD